MQNTGARLAAEAPLRGRRGCTGRSRVKGPGGVLSQADMRTLTAGFDPARTHLHNTFHSISHTTLFILHDGDTHNTHQGREQSVVRLLTVCKVLNMVCARIVWT